MLPPTRLKMKPACRGLAHAHTGLCAWPRGQYVNAGCTLFVGVTACENHAFAHTKLHFPRCQVGHHQRVLANEVRWRVGACNARENVAGDAFPRRLALSAGVWSNRQRLRNSRSRPHGDLVWQSRRWQWLAQWPPRLATPPACRACWARAPRTARRVGRGRPAA